MPDLPETRAHLEEGLGKNLWTGYSLAVRKQGVLRQLTGGDVPSPSASLPWYSAGKPVAAAGVLRVLEKHPALANLVLSETLPELSGSHAGTLTLESILSHQTGLRISESQLRGSPRETLDWFANITPSEFQLAPRQAAYDPAGGWWLLGQWLERRTGKPWQEFLENDLLAAGGLHELQFTPPSVRIRERRAGQWIEGDGGSGPGAGLTGTAAAMALFYEKLVQGQLLAPASTENMRRAVRSGQRDATLGHIVDFGLGVILNSNRYGTATVPYGFGTQAGAAAFGHGGARSSVAFADPDHHFTAAVFLNGRVPEAEHQPRMRTLLDRLRSELV